MSGLSSSLFQSTAIRCPDPQLTRTPSEFLTDDSWGKISGIVFSSLFSRAPTKFEQTPLRYLARVEGGYSLLLAVVSESQLNQRVMAVTAPV